MRINHNLLSLNVFQNYQKNLLDNSSALRKISSGSKVMSAKDNPNKLGQSEGFKLQLKGLQMASRNIQDGVSMIQTADQSMAGISENLLRMRELVISANSDTLAEGEREIIQSEIDTIKNSIDDLAKNTEFNGVKLIGEEEIKNNKNNITIKMAVGANSGESINIPKYNLSSAILKDKEGNSIADIDVITKDRDEAISTIDSALKVVSSARSSFGALQNRFETLAQNNENSEVMLDGASALITGADIAKEMIEFTRTNVLIEAGNYILAQTNQIPNDALRVLERL